MVDLNVNGRTISVAASVTVAELLRQLDVQGRYAVEVNTELVPRSRHATHRLQPGDRVEIVQAIGGG